MIRLISDFARRFGARLDFSERFIAEKHGRLFLLDNRLEAWATRGFYYAGVYLGKAKGRIFFPSFPLLAMIGERGANKIVVDDKTEWLFVCGRDVFRGGIVSVRGSGRKGTQTIVMNKRGECLGFGRVLCNLGAEKDRFKVAVKNISDIGDFLRREKRRRHRS